MLTLQRHAEKAFVVISLFLYSGALAPYISSTNPLHPVKEALPHVGLVISLLLMIARLKRVVSIGIREQFLWILMGLVLTSFYWSDDPNSTMEQVLPLLRVTVFGVYFGTLYRMREQIELVAATFGLAILLSIFLCVALPSYGVVGRGFIANMEDLVHTGAWRGVYIHKNLMGGLMMLSTIIFCVGAFCSKYRNLMWIGSFLSLFMIVQSRAKTPLVVLVVLLLLLPFYKALRWSYSKAIPFFIAIILVVGTVVVSVVSNAEKIFGSGQEITLTGRTDIWTLLMDKIAARPWLGYGYHAFWLNGWEGEAADIWRGLNEFGFEPPNAHNGFLEICLHVGLIGLTVFLLSFLSFSIRSVIWIRIIKTAEGFLPILYLTVLFLLNLTESLILEPDIYWVLYVAFTLSMYYNSVTDSIDFRSIWQQQMLEEKQITEVSKRYSSNS
jgi:O-antigen ligase